MPRERERAQPAPAARDQSSLSELELDELFELEFDEELELEFEELLSLELDEVLTLEFDEVLELVLEEVFELVLDEVLELVLDELLEEVLELVLLLVLKKLLSSAACATCTPVRAWGACASTRTSGTPAGISAPIVVGTSSAVPVRAMPAQPASRVERKAVKPLLFLGMYRYLLPVDVPPGHGRPASRSRTRDVNDPEETTGQKGGYSMERSVGNRSDPWSPRTCVNG